MRNITFNIPDEKGKHTLIKISEIGKLKAFDNKKKVYSFLVECEKENENIHFIFYNSIAFTEEIDNKKRFSNTGIGGGLNDKQIRGLIYDILACIYSDYFSEDTSLREFLNNYGYENTEENEYLFHRVSEQKFKLQKVFTETQISFFDENDDKLKKFVDSLMFKKENKESI